MRVWLCFLFSPLLCTTCLGQTIDDDDLKEAGVDLAFLVLGELPHVGKIFGVLAPITKKLLGLKHEQPQQQQQPQQQPQQQIDYSKDFKDIQRGLSNMTSKVLEAVGRVEMAVELEHVRTTEIDARALIGYLEDILKADNPSSINRTINEFLEQCKIINPYRKLMNMHQLTEKAYRLQFRNDIYHGKKSLDSMKDSLNGILQELTIVSVAQHQLSENESDEERKDNMKKWKGRLNDILDVTNNVFEALLHVEYWHDMRRLVENVINDHTNADLQSKAEKIAEYVFDIHTSDRFFVMVSREKLGGKMFGNYGNDASKFSAYAPEENRFSLEYGGCFVEIHRSITAHKMSSNDIASFHDTVDKIHKAYRVKCPFEDDSEYGKHVMRRNFTAVTMFEATANTFLYCDTTVTYSPPPFQCDIWHYGRWEHPTFQVHAMPL